MERSSQHAGQRLSVLVTGGSGYIGSHVVRALSDRFDVIVVDRRPPSPSVASWCRYHAGDVRDARRLDEVFASESVAAVVHVAGVKSVAASIKAPEEYFDINAHGSSVLLGAMARAGVNRVIFSSSAAVYGTPDTLPLTESSPLRPENPYGESKLLVERMLPWFDVCHGIRHVSLRYFNAAGASVDGVIGEDWSDAVNLLPVVIRAALGMGGPVEIFGSDYPTPDGTAIRDYVHVVDLATAHVAAVDYLLDAGASTTLNLGTGSGVSVRQVIDTVRRIGRLDVPERIGPRRAGDPAEVWADSGRATDVLHWRAELGLDDMVATAWRWHATLRR